MTWARSDVIFGTRGPYGGRIVRSATYFVGEANFPWHGVVYEERIEEQFGGIGAVTGPWLLGVALAAAPALAGVLVLVGCAVPRNDFYLVGAIAFTGFWVIAVAGALVDSLSMLVRQSPYLALPALTVGVIAWVVWVLRFPPAGMRAWLPILWVSLWGKTIVFYALWVGILALRQNSRLATTLWLTTLGGVLMLKRARYLPPRWRKSVG